MGSWMIGTGIAIFVPLIIYVGIICFKALKKEPLDRVKLGKMLERIQSWVFYLGVVAIIIFTIVFS